jgi:hypothetical protein
MMADETVLMGVEIAVVAAAPPIFATEQSVVAVAIVAMPPQVAAVAIVAVAKTAAPDFDFDFDLRSNRTPDLLPGFGSPSAVSTIQALCLA